jgi:hypothetical protein
MNSMKTDTRNLHKIQSRFEIHCIAIKKKIKSLFKKKISERSQNVIKYRKKIFVRKKKF